MAAVRAFHGLERQSQAKEMQMVYLNRRTALGLLAGVMLISAAPIHPVTRHSACRSA
jgi:hypothetical protein